MKDKIKTTINIKPYFKKMIYDASVAHNVTMSEIVTLIILKMIDKLRNNPDFKPKMFKSVKYQEKNKTLEWETPLSPPSEGGDRGVSYDPGVYEVANDLRRIVKKTVSRYIAEGIVEFLGEIIRDLCKSKKRISGDNYFPKYKFSAKIRPLTTFFTIFWDHPIQKFLKNYIIE